MNIRMKYALLAVFIGATLMLPMYAGSSLSTPRLIPSARESTAGPGSDIQALEVMDSYVDPFGGVYNVIGGAYNATQYGFSHITALENIVKDQMQNKNGFVRSSAFSLSASVPYPNGVVGAPLAVLELDVFPVLVIPPVRANAYYASLTQTDAISIADQFASVYDTALSISLTRFMISKNSTSWLFHYGIPTYTSCYGKEYHFVYLAVLTADQGVAAMKTLLNRLAGLGGFMSILAGTSWPYLLTTAVERYIPYYIMPHFQGTSHSVMDMLSSRGYPYFRSSNATDTEVIESSVMGGAAFDYPGYVNAVAGNESYSLKTLVGYTGSIENKMQQDSSADSLSIIGGETPGSLTMYGIPSTWMTINDQFKIPGAINIDGIHLPSGTTISDAMRTILSVMPGEAAHEVNAMIGGLNSSSLDFIVDHLWGVPGAYPDYKTLLLAEDYSAITTSVTEMNFDLLATVMKSAGLTPDTLIADIDPTVAAISPVGALVKAFVSFFDSYHILDILLPSNYATASGMAAYLNTFITGFEKALHDLTGYDVTTTFETKEGIATFVQAHWGIALQALWTAMAASDLSGVKTAFHNILNATNFQEHITPYLKADLGASLLGGIGFEFAVNFNGTAFKTMSANDLTFAFDSDPSTIKITGPYLAVVKSPSSRTVNLGDTINYTMNVHNYGDATAYDVKVLDGISAGLDGERQYYWTKSSLTAGETWEFTYLVKANSAGLFMDMPAICVYFNQSLSTFNPALNWTGTARYTFSAMGFQMNVAGPGGWLPSTLFGIPTLYVIAGVGGVAALGVALLIIRRRT